MQNHGIYPHIQPGVYSGESVPIPSSASAFTILSGWWWTTGSDDNTRQLLETWQAEDNSFPIRYIHQENGGKCRAINQGLKHASGLLFYTVDSDDYLTDDAFGKNCQMGTNSSPGGKVLRLFASNLGTAPDTTPNSLFPEGYFDGNAFDRYGGGDGGTGLCLLYGHSPSVPIPGISRREIHDGGGHLEPDGP